MPLIIERLKQGKYLGKELENSNMYNPQIIEAVHLFQILHGIDNDGVLGPKTLAAMNVPVEKRIEQIILNMERWRWMPEELAERHLRVNIAGFYLKAFEAGREIIDMPVIVGQPYRRTPVMNSTIENIIFNPYWHVPRRIAVDKLLPLIQENPDYLAQQEFEVFDEDGGKIQNPVRLNWSSFNKNYFPFRLRQDPGSKNALGHVRFSLVNDLSIYLHGTPDQDLFMQIDRAKSSGCIRVERPLELAEFVLEQTPNWPPAKIRETYYAYVDNPGIKPSTAPLAQPLSVYLQYWTAWVDTHGHVHFREDIYGRDEKLKTALFGQ